MKATIHGSGRFICIIIVVVVPLVGFDQRSRTIDPCCRGCYRCWSTENDSVIIIRMYRRRRRWELQ
jgi:hypothetical protein